MKVCAKYKAKKVLKSSIVNFLKLAHNIFYKNISQDLSISNLTDLNLIILLKKPLGIGDIVILSPMLYLLDTKLNFNSMYIFTDYEEFFKFKNLKWINDYEREIQILKNSENFIISPTFTLKHTKYLSYADFYLGYFFGNIFATNFRKNYETYKYNPKNEPYILRTFPILKFLNIKIDINNLFYPSLKEKKFPLNINVPYIVIAPFSLWKEKQYPIEYYKEIIDFIINETNYRIVIVGSKKREEILFNKSLSQNYKNTKLINLTGTTTIKELIYIISNSKLFIGNDSGPANIAYLAAPKVISIFGSVNPLTVLPINKEIRQKIKVFFPVKESCSALYCYDGFNKPCCTKDFICLKSIKPVYIKNYLKKIL